MGILVTLLLFREATTLQEMILSPLVTNQNRRSLFSSSSANRAYSDVTIILLITRG